MRRILNYNAYTEKSRTNGYVDIELLQTDIILSTSKQYPRQQPQKGQFIKSITCDGRVRVCGEGEGVINSRKMEHDEVREDAKWSAMRAQNTPKIKAAKKQRDVPKSERKRV